MASKNRILVLSLVVLAAVAVPHTRNVLMYQVMLSLRPADAVQYGFVNGGETRTEPRDAQDALVIALREGRAAESINAYWRMIEQYPDDPALYANMLRYASLWGPLRNRPHASQPERAAAWKPLPDSPELQKVARAVEMGKKLEPDNAYFDCFEAVLCFNQGRDSEGLAAIHRAAAKKGFEDHVFDELDALARDCRDRVPEPLYWLNPAGRVAQACAVLFPHYMHFRNAARVAGNYIEQDIRQGRHDRALARATDLINLGGLLRDRSATNIGVLVGISVQKLAVFYMHQGLDGPELSSELTGVERLSELRALIPDGFSSSQWQALHDSFARSDEWRVRMKHFAGRDWDRTLRFIALSAVLLMGGGYMLVFMVILGLVWIVSRAWLARRGRAGITGVGPSRLSAWLLMILPPVIVLLVLAFVQWQIPFGMSGLENTWPLRAAVVSVVISVPLGLVIIAAARTRLVPDVGRFDTFLTRLRTGSIYAVQALVMLYLLATVAAVPVIVRANHVADTFFRTETQQIWKYELPAKK